MMARRYDFEKQDSVLRDKPNELRPLKVSMTESCIQCGIDVEYFDMIQMLMNDDMIYRPFCSMACADTFEDNYVRSL